MAVTDFRDRKLVFIDLEMTGLNPLVHEITEIGAVIVNGRTLEIEREFEAKVKPQHIETASPEALQISGYSAEAWKNARPQKEVLTELAAMVPEGLIAGWNVGTDKMFLEIGYIREQIPFPFDYHSLDVIPLAWKYAQTDPELKELRLSALCERLGIIRTDMHRALADIKVTVEVFRKLIDK